MPATSAATPSSATTAAAASPADLVLLDQVAAFKYVTVPEAPTYRAIVQLFHEARQRYVVELRPAELLEALHQGRFHHDVTSEERLTYFLESLVEWGNLTHRQDTAAVDRIEDFYRRSYLYTLTAVGEAAHRAVVEVESTVGRSGSLQTSMLYAIRDTLRELARAGEDAIRVMRCWHDLVTAFDTLTTEATRFLGDLDRRHDHERADEQWFVHYKQALFAYISRFVEQVRRLAADIRAGIEAVQAHGVKRLLRAAARSGDLPPTADGSDPAVVWVAGQLGRWQGLAGWFVGDAGRRATVDRLAEAAVDAVVELTRTLSRLNDRRTRPVDRAADFRTLALWFARCQSDAEAHALFQSAFGMYGSRHMHIAEEDPELTPSSASWWDGPPVAVPVRLRTRGQVSHGGRTRQAADYSATRQWIEVRRRRERAQLDAALTRFSGRGPVCLSDLASLDEHEFDLLLQLLDETLSHPLDRGGARRARTTDGRLDVMLRLLPHRPPVLLRTPRGTLRCRDHELTVAQVRLDPRAAEAVQAGGATHREAGP